MLLLALLVVFDGLAGSPIAPRNLAGVLPWVHWRGLTALTLLLAGSLFCFACPFVLVRRIAKAAFPADRTWPRRLRGKWLAAALLIAYFWFYEAFDPWALPWLTSVTVLAYFGAALAVDGAFRGATFCKYLCPIGHFNFINSTCSPLEVRARDVEVCRHCTTRDCMVGRRGDGAGQQGCELFLFQEQKIGNLDCTFCLDCAHACPYDNVGLIARVPAAELLDGRRRSGIGRLLQRRDLAFLALATVFGAYLNALGMVGPFHDFEVALMRALRVDAEWLILLVLFAVGLGVVPALLVGLTALLTKLLAGSEERATEVATRFAFALVPLGFGIWAAHYAFHFLTGGLTAVPVAQSFLADLGVPLLGTPRWDLGPLVPESWLFPIKLVSLEAGALVSLVVAFRMAAARYGDGGTARRAFLPWALLILLLLVAAVWVMAQPMEMRGTVSAG